MKGGTANVFCTFVRHDSPACRSAVLFVPPFAEELNKARRQVAVAARMFAALGHCVLIVDLFGTGDSEGDFRAARWNIWLDDLRAGCQLLRSRGLELRAVWALRAGALLAADLMDVERTAARLLLWNPVTNGERHVEQFLRTRVAAAMAGGGRASTSVKELRAQIERDETLEVAGYELHRDLVRQIGAKDLSRSPPPASTRVLWLEVVAEATAGISVPSQRTIAAWRAAGTQVEAETVVGMPFWSTIEIAVTPELNVRTASLLGPS